MIIMKDYELTTCSTLTLAEVFDCKTGVNLALKSFRGPFHLMRAKLWVNWLLIDWTCFNSFELLH